MVGKFTIRQIFYLLVGTILLAGCNQEPAIGPIFEGHSETREAMAPTAEIIIDGLINPVGIEPLPDGSLLIAEEGTGERDDSAGVTLMLPDNTSGRLISGLPSGRDAGDLSGVPFVKWRDGKLYLSHFNLGALYTFPLDPTAGLELAAEPFTAEDLTKEMVPLNAVQLRNPFDLAFNENGIPIVTDATDNGVAMMTPNGQTRFFHRFDMLVNPSDGKTRIDPVPTGIERIDDEYFITLTSGCPYPESGGLLVAIDTERNQRTVLDGLSMPIDIAQAPDGTLWLLEFARFAEGGNCFKGQDYLPNSGRLSRLSSDGQPELILQDLNYPGSIDFDLHGDLLVSEIFNGRVLKVTNPNRLEPATSIAGMLGETVATVPTPIAKEAAYPLQFVNVAQEVGLDFKHGAFVTGEISADPVAMMGGGVCWLDYDNDGWLDLYVVNSHALAEKDYWLKDGRLPQNQLYHNAEGRFIKATLHSQTGLAMRGNGCVAADLNRDGWTDIYVTADGPNKLLWNMGDGTFQEGAETAGVAGPMEADLAEWNSAASIGDLNHDGWPDLFVAAYINLENKVEKPVGAFPQDFYGLADHFYLNNGDGTFREITAELGLVREERGLGSVMSDLDNDGDLDLYIANDGHPNRLYITELDDSEIGFKLIDASRTSGTNDPSSGMGIATGDYDNDGHFDLLVTNWDTELNALFRNQIAESGELDFRYSTYKIGIAGLGNNITGWGTAWIDFDHDGDEDLLVVNGHVPITDLTADAQLVRLYGNRLAEGKPNQFREWTSLVGLGEDGLGPQMARGSATADFDNDGDIDVAINTIGGNLILLENKIETNNWFSVSIPDALPGCTATLTLPDGSTLVREIRAGSSYLASEDPRLHFGTGIFEDGLSLTLSLADGRQFEFSDLKANQYFEPDL
ncbi:MAG: ScyD/ScyE family protein [Anaerolineae bacterium]